MKGDITVYITPYSAKDCKKYNKTILEVMENSKIDYKDCWKAMES